MEYNRRCLTGQNWTACVHAQEWVQPLTKAVLRAVARPEVLAVLVVHLQAIHHTPRSLGPVACLNLGLGHGDLGEAVLHLCLPAAGLLHGSPDLDFHLRLAAEGLLATQVPRWTGPTACNSEAMSAGRWDHKLQTACGEACSLKSLLADPYGHLTASC